MNSFSYETKTKDNSKSCPIKIPKKNTKCEQQKVVEEYLLDFNAFDPSKFSPPSDWKIRLEKRIQSYDNLQKLIDN